MKKQKTHKEMRYQKFTFTKNYATCVKSQRRNDIAYNTGFC